MTPAERILAACEEADSQAALKRMARALDLIGKTSGYRVYEIAADALATAIEMLEQK